MLLRLGAPDQFRYMAGGCSQYFLSQTTEKSLPADRLSGQQQKLGALKDQMLDDVNDFKAVDQDLANIGMSDAERLSVYTTIATVLHIGNISFEDDPDDNRGGSRVTDKSEGSLTTTASLMGLDADELRRALTARVMQATKGGYKGTVIMVPLKVHEANSARDALAKSLYSRLFDHIVKKINQSIPFQSSSYYIGVLDIAGFEYFTENSFEQFCINYCNEKLQQFFNQRVLKDEQELYKKEGLGVKDVSFVDNQDCINLIEAKGTGIFSLLDEESKLPKSNCQHFTSAVHNNNGNHFRLALPRKSRLKEHREIRDEDGFLIRHFAGAVCYTTKRFIEKNNDALHASLEAVAQDCKNQYMELLFRQGAGGQKNGGKLTFESVGNKFKTQLSELMKKLHSTGTNFIRCIKPNVKMVAHMFDGGSVLSQLQCAGMTSVLELMQQGYPSRAPFSDIYNMYKKFLPPDLARLDPRLFCKALFKALGLDDNDFKFGMTKVFFRPGKFAEFDTLMRSDPENLKVLIGRVKQWLLHSQWKKAQWCALSVIKLKNKIAYRQQALVTIQKTVKMYIAKKKHRPRYQALVKIRYLHGQVQQIGSMAKSLKASDKDGVEKNVKKIQDSIVQASQDIKGNENIKKADIEKKYTGLVDQINKELSHVKGKLEKQKVAEEQMRLKKIQQEMEAERMRKEAEEAAARKQEEERKQKMEMEAKRKKEEEARRKQEEKDKATLESMQKDLENANAKLADQQQQERRDHELALRLAEESGDVVEELATPGLKRSSKSLEAQSAKKYNLAKWKYAELRDTINTSCDIELLEACREEFHRRLKVYHAWKARNKKKNSTFEDNMRAPTSILNEANKTTVVTPKKSTSSNSGGQRFFRIPFVKPGAHEGTKGWWFAHFDGEWIGRQMELHPGREAVLLLAGKDDMQMCELSLDDTGLTRKRGAEILEHEFEEEWSKHGGAAYNRPNDRKKNGK
jgi:myosin-6